MTRKGGICQKCNEIKILYIIEQTDCNVTPIEKTINWWCMKCWKIHRNPKGWISYNDSPIT